jgi:hypothetical protein
VSRQCRYRRAKSEALAFPRQVSLIGARCVNGTAPDGNSPARAEASFASWSRQPCARQPRGPEPNSGRPSEEGAALAAREGLTHAVLATDAGQHQGFISEVEWPHQSRTRHSRQDRRRAWRSPARTFRGLRPFSCGRLLLASSGLRRRFRHNVNGALESRPGEIPWVSVIFGPWGVVDVISFLTIRRSSNKVKGPSCNPVLYCSLPPERTYSLPAFPSTGRPPGRGHPICHRAGWPFLFGPGLVRVLVFDPCARGFDPLPVHLSARNPFKRGSCSRRRYTAGLL